MNFKRIVLISLILCFLSLACVSASENQTSIENSNFDNINVIDVGGEEINEYDNDMFAGKNVSEGQGVVSVELLSSSNVNDKLSASKVGTRDELNNMILAAKDGSTITLDKDYGFLGAVKPIEITKSIVIDGKGHTITLGYNNAFNLKYVSSIRKIEIKNINFVRGDGGAIIADGKCPYIISNCKFINCSRGGLAGAISATAEYNSQIIDCTFKRCYAFGETKTVRWETSATMTSTASSSGGASVISQSVFCNVLQYERRDSVDEFSPDSMFRTAFREIPLRSAATCCDRLTANLDALRFSPRTLSISSFVRYTISYPIRSVDANIVAQQPP